MFLIEGEIKIGNQKLEKRDGCGVSGIEQLEIIATKKNAYLFHKYNMNANYIMNFLRIRKLKNFKRYFNQKLFNL